jgi:transcriptional regulator with XRE-family HTH domain
VEDYAERLRVARKAAGLSVEEATFQVRVLMNRKLSKKTLERLELEPRPEDRADEWLIVALCRVYDVDPWTVSPAIAERADRLALLLRSNDHRGRGAATRRYHPAAA